MMKILLPVDGSDYTKRMLAYLAAHEELLGPKHDYLAFTAVHPIPSHASRFLDRGTLDAYYNERAEEVLRPVRRFAEQTGWTLRVSHHVGDAAAAIAHVVEVEQPDLIVMGSHGHTALGNVLMGSVTSGVLARCKAPVLLVR
jgi:nucleotide-binding universal stress UspA family protein